MPSKHLYPFLPLLLLLLPSLHTTATPTHPTGIINPTLHTQALSHLAFHSNPLKLALATLIPSSAARSIAVVGVEWGEEVLLFASHGHHVYAFEPARKFLTHLRDQLSHRPAANVTVVPIAAGRERAGTLLLQYDNAQVRERVPRGRLDDHVRQRLAVLSLDIQGRELDVLRGSGHALRRGVDTLWVEAIACNEDVAGVLEMLDHQYVIFDFVPWGMRKSFRGSGVPRTLDSFAFRPDRPADFEGFLEWMCRVKNEHYQWLQTDFLAVRRDLLSEGIMERLTLLADRECGIGKEKADCLLKRLLLSDKDEL